MRSRPVVLSLALIFGTVAAGLVVRFAALGLPRFAVKYGGSMLWALMIYWIISTLLRSSTILRVALLSAFVTSAIESFKLYRSPGMDAFRLTVPGMLVLGRFFSPFDIVAYMAAIVVGAFLDWHLRRA